MIEMENVAFEQDVSNYKPVRVTFDTVIISTFTPDKPDIKVVPNKHLKVLLIKREDEPYKDMWSLPGGFVDYDKSITDCMKEKLFNKVGAMNVYAEQLYTYGDDVNRDPRDRVISVAHIALLPECKINEYINTQEAKLRAEWFVIDAICTGEDQRVFDVNLVNIDVESKSDLIVSELAFDHKQILVDALNRLRGKVMYTDIAFNLVDKMFTVGELEKCYEAILGESIPAFRRFIAPKITEIIGDDMQPVYDSHTSKIGHRPSKLYKRKNMRRY